MTDDSTREGDDATAAALRRLADDGSDLSRPMEIDFFVAVPSHEVGEAVARSATALGFAARLHRDTATSDWTCYCTKTIVPSYELVRAIEKQLDALARDLGGFSDGFGSYGNAPEAN